MDVFGATLPMDDLLGRMLKEATRNVTKARSSRTPYENFLEVVSYSVSFGAFYVFVCYAKRAVAKFEYQRERSAFSRLIYSCVGEKDESEGYAKRREAAEATQTSGETFLSGALKLASCVLGIQISYLLWGLMQERIMTQPYETGELFRSSKFLVFANRFLALLVAWCEACRTARERTPKRKQTERRTFWEAHAL